MCLHIDTMYEQNQLVSNCSICGYYSGGRFSPPLRYRLMDDNDYIGDVCERCAFGTSDLWRVAMMSYASRLDTKAAFLRTMATRVEDSEPAQEGIAEDLLRQNINRQVPGRPGFLPPRPPMD